MFIIKYLYITEGVVIKAIPFFFFLFFLYLFDIMAKIQKYGIKFPITILSDEKSLFDTNVLQSDSVLSELMHILFTPKGQRLRDPEFGTNLIQFIYNPNDMQTWDDVVLEVKNSVVRYLKDCKINNIEIYEGEDGNGLYVKFNYSVWDGGKVRNYNAVAKI